MHTTWSESLPSSVCLLSVCLPYRWPGWATLCPMYTIPAPSTEPGKVLIYWPHQTHTWSHSFLPPTRDWIKIGQSKRGVEPPHSQPRAYRLSGEKAPGADYANRERKIALLRAQDVTCWYLIIMSSHLCFVPFQGQMSLCLLAAPDLWGSLTQSSSIEQAPHSKAGG